MNNDVAYNSDDSFSPQIFTQEVEEKFESKMYDIELKQKEQETKKKSLSVGVPYINLVGFPINPEVLSLIPEETAKELKVIAFFGQDKDIRIAAVDPEKEEVRELADEIGKKINASTELYIVTQHSFDKAFKLYDVLPKIRPMVAGVKITKEDFERFEKEIQSFQDLETKIQDVSMTDMVTLIIATAMKSRASDIHIETEENEIKVRFRIDGILQDVATIPKSAWTKVIARIKLLSKLKINITAKPQDGRFTIFLTSEKIDVRVSCLPTSYGESVVMRLLMSSAVGISFENLGLRGKAYADLLKEMSKPNGMIITTGPTGSGKTTTLYAMLNQLNDKGTKIITIEDPIEYRVDGINQSQVDESRGYSFANGLRSILRQDPDVIMVGEIRDLETADIAINAALTGHLVLSTLHTNDAFGTVPRFLAMNVKSFLLAPSLNAMIGQRLVRRVCQHCKKEYKPKSEDLTKVKRILESIPKTSGYNFSIENLKFYQGSGCDSCQGLGYWGRVGIFEIMAMNKEVENLILSGHVSEYDMLKIALKNNSLTMIHDGILKAIEGVTTVEEVFRVAKDTSGIYLDEKKD